MPLGRPATKRAPAADTEEAAPRKAAKGGRKAPADPAAERCALVREALLEAEHLPEAVRDTLCAGVHNSLGQPKAERRVCQEKFAELIGEALVGTEEALGHAISDAEHAAREAAVGAEQPQAAEAAAIAALEAKREEVAEKAAAVKRDVEALAAARKALKASQVAQVGGDAEITEAETKKAALEAAMAESYAPLKDGGAATARAKQQHTKALRSLAKDVELDPALLDSLLSVLGHAPVMRSGFEALVLQQFEEAVAKRLAALLASIEVGASARAERAAAVDAAQAAVEAAKEAHDASGATLAQVKSEQRETEAAKEEAIHAVKAAAPGLEAASARLEEARERLTGFQEGPLAAFHELKDGAPTAMDEANEAAEQAPAMGEAAEEAGADVGAASASAPGDKVVDLQGAAPEVSMVAVAGA